MIHFVPETVTSGDSVLARRETRGRQSFIAVIGNVDQAHPHRQAGRFDPRRRLGRGIRRHHRLHARDAERRRLGGEGLERLHLRRPIRHLRQPLAERVLGVFVRETGERPAVRHPAEESTRRIRLRLADAERAQRGRIEDRAVARPGLEHQRPIAGDRIQGRARRARIVEDGRADLPDDPVSRGRVRDRRLDSRDHLVERRIVLDGRRPFEPRRRRHRAGMRVCVVEAGDQQPAAGVDRPRGPGGRRLDLGRRPDGGDPVRLDADRLGPGTRGVARIDARIENGEIRRRGRLRDEVRARASAAPATKRCIIE